MSDHIQHTISDNIEPETPIGPQLPTAGWLTRSLPAGGFARVLVIGFITVILAFFGIGIHNLANAADGSTGVVHLTPAMSDLGSQVPPTPIVTGNNCKIRVVGQSTPNSRIVIRQLFDSAPAYTRGYANVDENGMIQEVRMSDDHIPGYDQGVRIQLSIAQLDDSVTALEPVLTVFVVNDVNSGCSAQ